LVSHIEGSVWAGDFREWSAEEDIWNRMAKSRRKLNNSISRFCSSLTKYYSGDGISRIRWEGHMELWEKNRDPWRVLERKSDGHIRLGRPGREG